MHKNRIEYWGQVLQSYISLFRFVILTFRKPRSSPFVGIIHMWAMLPTSLGSGRFVGSMAGKNSKKKGGGGDALEMVPSRLLDA
jgi:hypothetical protein